MGLFLGPGAIRRADGWTMDDNILHREHEERRIWRAAVEDLDDGGVKSTRRGVDGGQRGAAPRGGMVNGVVRERLHEGRRLWTMGEGGGERRIRWRRGGQKNYGWHSLAYFCREPGEGIIWREKKRYLPLKVGNIPGEVVGKNTTQESGTIVLGTVGESSFLVLGLFGPNFLLAVLFWRER